MNQQADVTVVVPTHDRPALLRATLSSILAQLDVVLEAVVVDDGSDPPPRATLDAVADDRVRVVRHEEPQGVVAARNTGIACASTPWVAFCDDDDLWAPDKLRRQLDAADAAGCRWVYTGSVDIDRAGRVLGGGPPAPPQDMPRLLTRFNAVSGGGSGTVIHASLLAEVGGFAPEFQGSHLEDWELWLRLLRRERPAWVPAPLVGYRVHGTNASLRVDDLVAGVRRLEQRHGVTVDRAAFYRTLGWTAHRAGQPRVAAGYFLRAAARGPRRPLAREVAGSVRSWVGGRMGGVGTPRSDWERQAQAWLDRLPAR